MIRLALAMTLTFLAGPIASAATEGISASKSDLFYQASKGELVLTPSIEYNNESGQVLGDQRKIEDSGRIMKLKVETGITESFSAAVQVNYKDAKLNEDRGYKVDSEGIEDVHLNLHGFVDLEEPTATLHYGAFVRHSVDRTKVTKAKAEFTGTTIIGTPLTQDPHSAGSSITPYIGYSKVVGPYVLGARFLQTAWGSERKKRTEVNRDKVPDPLKPNVEPVKKSTEEGGGATELKVFAERSFKKLTMNVATKFRHTSPIKNIEPVNEVIQDELDMLALEITPSYKLNSQTELIGGLGYTRLLNQNVAYQGQTVSSGEIYSLSVGGRFSF